LHGAQEIEAFARLDSRSAAASTDSLCRLVLLEILPALAERDFHLFGEAIYELNRQSGMMFASLQGGIYANVRTAEVIDYVRQLGIRGAGQSSWGPGVFAITEDEPQACWLANALRNRFGFQEAELRVAQRRDRGAETLQA
jgi:predicted sugar kinase